MAGMGHNKRSPQPKLSPRYRLVKRPRKIQAVMVLVRRKRLDGVAE